MYLSYIPFTFPELGKFRKKWRKNQLQNYEKIERKKEVVIPRKGLEENYFFCRKRQIYNSAYIYDIISVIESNPTGNNLGRQTFFSDLYPNYLLS